MELSLLFSFILISGFFVEINAQAILEVDGEKIEPKYIYHVRLPDPFESSTNISRLILVEKPIPKEILQDKWGSLEAFIQANQRGVLVDLKDDGTAIAVRMNGGKYSTMWTGSFIPELHFEGTISDKEIKGQLTTEPEMSVFNEKDMK